MSQGKSTANAKPKATSHEERMQLWKQHFENLLGNPPKVTHGPITRIIRKQLETRKFYTRRTRLSTKKN